MGRACGTYGVRDSFLPGLVGKYKYKGKCWLSSTAIRIADNIGIYQQEVGCGFEPVGYILGYGQAVGYGECCNEPPGSVECGELIEQPIIHLQTVQLISLTSCLLSCIVAVNTTDEQVQC